MLAQNKIVPEYTDGVRACCGKGVSLIKFPRLHACNLPCERCVRDAIRAVQGAAVWALRAQRGKLTVCHAAGASHGRFLCRAQQSRRCGRRRLSSELVMKQAPHTMKPRAGPGSVGAAGADRQAGVCARDAARAGAGPQPAHPGGHGCRPGARPQRRGHRCAQHATPHNYRSLSLLPGSDKLCWQRLDPRPGEHSMLIAVKPCKTGLGGHSFAPAFRGHGGVCCVQG